MNFKDLCTQRYSVRGYAADAVGDDDINYILDCARLAPSAVNYQPWKFYVVKSDEGRAQLRRSYHREWFDTAPLYIVCVICHDASWHRQADGKDHGDIDIATAAEHICLAAAERGLGSCWVCNFDAKMVHAQLQLADTEEVAVLIPIGRPADGVAPVAKKRKEICEIVRYL